MFANLFAEAVGIAITVGLVDVLLGMERERKQKPARLAAFREADNLFRTTSQFLLAVGRSTVLDSDLEALRRETSTVPDWLVSRFTDLAPTADAPWASDSPGGSVGVLWADAFPWQVKVIRAALDRYLARYSAAGNPELTEAIQRLEDNALFNVSDAGAHFWSIGVIQEQFWREFVERFEALGDVLRKLAQEHPEVSLHHTRFNWNGLAVNIEAEPVGPTAPWRQTPERITITRASRVWRPVTD